MDFPSDFDLLYGAISINKETLCLHRVLFYIR